MGLLTGLTFANLSHSKWQGGIPSELAGFGAGTPNDNYAFPELFLAHTTIGGGIPSELFNLAGYVYAMSFRDSDVSSTLPTQIGRRACRSTGSVAGT